MEAIASARTLALPSHLSDSAEPLAALARKCYPDMVVSVAGSPDGWLVRLAPVGELARAYDPGIVSVLAGMGIDCNDLMSWHLLGNVGGAVWLESMYHSWALVAWSQWLRSAADAVRPLVIHVARNHDLGTPALLCGDKPTVLMSIMEDLAFELADPSGVRTAVERGLIGVGSYITPLLSARPGDVLHLAPAVSAEDDMATRRRFNVETSPQRSDKRLVVCERLDGACSYRKTRDPSSLADDWNLAQPVLLDIDLGYFDLVPKRRREPVGVPCTISQLIDGIKPMAGAIAAVTVAYSVAFCPSARWATLATELRSALSSLVKVST
jgi:hypothetical protein